jgi:hypothetical protein
MAADDFMQVAAESRRLLGGELPQSAMYCSLVGEVTAEALL